MDADFERVRKDVASVLEAERTMVLATCSLGRVTARTVSVVTDGLSILFQTDCQSIKAEQMQSEHRVALCTGNIQIEGEATLLGHPLDGSNRGFVERYRAVHSGAYERYSAITTEVVVRVEPTLISLWKYVDGRVYKEILNISERKVLRELYSPSFRETHA